MICAGPVYPGWLGSGSHLMLPTRFLTTSLARSREFAAVYQRHEFLAERQEALERWGTHVDRIVGDEAGERRPNLQRAA